MKHKNKRKYLSPLMFVLFSSFLILSLACRDNQQDMIGQEIRDVIKDTIPPRAIMASATQIDKNTTRVLGAWEFQSSGDWKQYAEWVTRNLTGRYELIATENNSLNFRRSLTGDIYEFANPNYSVNPLHVRVDFIARPN